MDKTEGKAVCSLSMLLLIVLLFAFEIFVVGGD